MLLLPDPAAGVFLCSPLRQKAAYLIKRKCKFFSFQKISIAGIKILIAVFVVVPAGESELIPFVPVSRVLHCHRFRMTITETDCGTAVVPEMHRWIHHPVPSRCFKTGTVPVTNRIGTPIPVFIHHDGGIAEHDFAGRLPHSLDGEAGGIGFAAVFAGT